VIPLYGFLEGDTLGLLILAEPEMTLDELSQRLRSAARVRCDPSGEWCVTLDGVALDSNLTVAQANLTPLQRFDVRKH
jgi:hypothetical protein